MKEQSRKDKVSVEMWQKNGMTNGVKSGRQIENRQEQKFIVILSREVVIINFEECCFSAMTSPIRWLIREEQIVCLKMIRALKENDCFQYFRKKGEIGDRSVVLSNFRIKSWLSRVVSWWQFGKELWLRELLMVDIKWGRRSSRQPARREVGRGSRSHVFTVICFSVFLMSSSDTVQTQPEKGVSGTEGGGTVTESEDWQMVAILLWKKSQNCWGSLRKG